MLRSLAAASLLCCALPAFAQTSAQPAPKTSSAAVAQTGAAAPSTENRDDIGLQLDGRAAARRPSAELALPNFEDLDVKVLKDIHLCIFPFIREDKVGEAPKGGGQNLEQDAEDFLWRRRAEPRR